MTSAARRPDITFEPTTSAETQTQYNYHYHHIYAKESQYKPIMMPVYNQPVIPIKNEPDPNFGCLQKIRDYLPSSRPQTARRILPIESPVLRHSVTNPFDLPPYARRRNGLLFVLIASISIGTSLGYAGAQAYDEFELYLNRLRDERDMNPYR